METEEPKPPRVKYANRVTIPPDLLEKIDVEIEQVTSAKRGIHLTRTDYVTYRLKKAPKKLPSDEVDELIALFYDDERFLKEALKEVREAKARGEKPASQFSGLSSTKAEPRKRRPPKAVEIPLSTQLTYNPAEEQIDDESGRLNA